MDTTIQIRTNNILKEKAKKVFVKKGVTMSYAFNSFLEQVVRGNISIVPKFTIPADPKFKNWREEMEYEVKNGKRYSSAEEMWKDVDNW